MLSYGIRVSMAMEPVYVTQMRRCYDRDLFSVALSTYLVKVYSLREAASAHVCNLSGHGAAVTDQIFKSAFNPDCLLTCTEDGSLREWDVRNGKATLRFRHESALTCLAIREHVVATGTEEGTICFLDDRKNSLLTEFNDVHASSVVQIGFHPQLQNLFFSGSDDGMLSVFDFLYGLDEDESFKAGQNLDPISQFGFFGSNNERLWCQSSQHGLTLWNWSEGMRQDSTAGTTPYYTNPDIRPALKSERFREITSCITCFSAGEDLTLVGGDGEGGVGLFRLRPPTLPQSAVHKEEVHLETALKGGHLDIVRSFLRWDASTYLTGGEDAKICVWKTAAMSDSGSCTVSHVQNRERKVERAKPY